MGEHARQRDDHARTGHDRQTTARSPEERIQYDEITCKQPNTIRIEPGATAYDLAREGTAPDKVMAKGEHECPGPTESPREDGTYENQFSREGARIHGTEDDRDKPYEYRDRAWQPDETKDLELDEMPEDNEPGSAHAP
jgi:hypothetical protein